MSLLPFPAASDTRLQSLGRFSFPSCYGLTTPVSLEPSTRTELVLVFLPAAERLPLKAAALDSPHPALLKEAEM